MPRAASKTAAGRAAEILRAQSRRPVSGRGFVLSRCRPDSAYAWARRGLGPLVVAELEGWTVVAPDGPPKARFPYDDAVRTLAGRPVGLRMRPALGFFQVGRQAVVTVHPAPWRAVERWLVWTPRDGIVPLTGLPDARLEELAQAAGLDGEEADAAAVAVARIVTDGGSDAASVLAAILAALGLPGADLVSGALQVADLPDVRRIEPKDRHARSFDRLIKDEERYRLEEDTQ